MKNYFYSDSTEMGGNPASVDMHTGVIVINHDVWKHLSDVQKQLILLHEKAHLELNTQHDEIACDRWALNAFAGTRKNSLKLAVDAYMDLLDKPFIDPERKIQILKSVLAIDARRFGNKRAEALLLEFENADPQKAQLVMTISAIVAAAGAAVNVARTSIIGKRNQWAKGAKSKKTSARLSILQSAAQNIVASYVQRRSAAGVAAVEKYVLNRTQLQEDIFYLMGDNGVFDDDNIFTKNWAKKGSSEFFKSKNYGWTREYMNKYADTAWEEWKAKLLAMGAEDDTEEGKQKSSAKTAKISVIWIAVAIVGFLIIRKIL